jgi:hypothetical protein
VKEDDYRLTALKTSYGLGTRSFARSAEKKEMDRQRKRITEEYKPGESVTMPAMCTCALRPYAHEIFLHRQVLNWDGDWRQLWSKEMRQFWRPPQEADSMGLENAVGKKA